MKTHKITARDIPDAWFQCIYDVQNPAYSRIWKIDEGSYAGQQRMEFESIVIDIKNPCFGQLGDRICRMPEAFQGSIPDPIDDPAEEYIVNYFLNYLFSDKLEPGEQYTYGSRIMEQVTISCENAHLFESVKTHCIPAIASYISAQGKEMTDFNIPQYYAVCAYLRDSPGTNQCVLQVAKPSDIALPDPPCLRSIGIKVIDGTLYWYIYFRSWDLFAGFPANLAGLTLLMEQMSKDTGYKTGPFRCYSHGLHLYDYQWKIAATRIGR